MDARMARDKIQRDALRSQLAAAKPSSTRTWYEYFFGETKKAAMVPEDAAHQNSLKAHFTHMLDTTDPPAVFKPSEVAQMLTPAELKSMGYEKWEEAVPAVYHLAFETRAFGDCDILRQGVIIDDDIGIDDLDGPIRIRRAEM